MRSIITVTSDELTPPTGHYSHAVAHGGILYVSGQLGRGSGMTDLEAGDAQAQTFRALSAVDAIIRAAGATLSRVLKMTIYVSDVALWPAVNAEYARFMGEWRPARVVVPTGPLHHGALVEIDAMVALD